MKKEKSVLQEACRLYAKKSYLDERLYIAQKRRKDKKEVEKQVIENQEKIRALLPQLQKIIKKPKQTIKYLKVIIRENRDEYACLFATPILDEFINAIIFDLMREKNMNRKAISQLKQKYAKLKVEIYI